MPNRLSTYGAMNAQVNPNLNRNPWEPGSPGITLPQTAQQQPAVSPAAGANMSQLPSQQSSRVNIPQAPAYGGPTTRVGQAWGQPAYGGPTNRLAVNWDYQASPEYQFRLNEAQKALRRNLMAKGRLDSTYGYDVLGRQASQIAGEEVDKQYQRALGAEATNYGRGFTEEGVAYGRGVDLGERNLNRENINYGRGTAEEQARYARDIENANRYLQGNQINYGRGWQEGEQDWMRNMQLAQLAFQASNPGYGASYGNALGNLYSNQGYNMAGIAQNQGAVQGNLLQSLLNSGYTYLQAQEMMQRMQPTQQGQLPLPDYGTPGMGAGGLYSPNLQAPSGAINPQSQQYNPFANAQIQPVGQYGSQVNTNPYMSQAYYPTGSYAQSPGMREQVDVTLKF